ncbi:mdm2-binding protein [Synchiropus picturatus]
MDRYVLVLLFSPAAGEDSEDADYLQQLKELHEHLVKCSDQESPRGDSALPACSLTGCPSSQTWHFAVQVFHRGSQFCSSEWEEVRSKRLESDSEEENPTTLESCASALAGQDGVDEPAQTELIEEAAEGLHLLSDKLPPPGKALVDVLMLSSVEEPPAAKDLLPLLGALKHMGCWHSAKINIVTPETAGWRKLAAYLGADMVEPGNLCDCINSRDLWRGGLLVREKKFVSELCFEGFSLRSLSLYSLPTLLLNDTTQERQQVPEVFHYYAPVLDLLHIISLQDLPHYLMSNTFFELCVFERSARSRLLLEQLKSLRGKVAALFSLSCTVTPVAQPPASQLSSQRWRETLAKKPKSIPVPEVEVKGENLRYLLLVQGLDSVGDGELCQARMLYSDSQVNGAAAMATVSGMLAEKTMSAEAGTAGDILRSLPRLQGNDLLRREAKVLQLQTMVLKDYIKKKEETSSSTSISVTELKAILRLVRERYFEMVESTQPAAACLTDDQQSMEATSSGLQSSEEQELWPEKSALYNIENQQKRRQKQRFGVFGPGTSDSLLGPKEGQKAPATLLDAKELLKHFTPDGKPAGELQPLSVARGPNPFLLSPDLSPGRVGQMSFEAAAASHYHGIEFCLDKQRALERDQGFVRLQSRLIRYETQTTCSKEPAALPFALSPAPSPAVMLEPRSVPDGETLLNADVARLKLRSRNTDTAGGPSKKRMAKSESSDSPAPQSSSRTIRSLRQQPGRCHSTSSLSASSTTRRTSSGLAKPSSADKPKSGDQKTSGEPSEDKTTKESRSQKHNRMLQDVVAKTLALHGIGADHKCFQPCSKRLFDISKFYLRDLKTSRGLHDEMKKAAASNVKQVIDWVLEKSAKKT